MAIDKQQSLKNLVCYLHGLQDAGVLLGSQDHEYAEFLHADVMGLLELYAEEDTDRDASLGDFDKGGKWRRAANVLIQALDKKSRAMTANYEYPEGLPWGDTMYKAVVTVARKRCGVAI